MNILIVDSSVLVIKRTAELLSELANIKSIHLADSFEKALKLFIKVKPQVVLLDVGLPLSKSIELLKNIRITKRETVVIVLATHATVLTEQKFRSAGADFFFDKYRDIEKLTAAINKLAS